MTESSPAVSCQDLGFAYRAGREVLSLEPLVITRGERLFLHGPSGSGKTTLLGLLAGVLTPTRGRVEVLGQNLATSFAACISATSSSSST